MGEAADDAFDEALREQMLVLTMKDAGAKRCHTCEGNFYADFECSTCHDLGWIDKDGKPCEP